MLTPIPQIILISHKPKLAPATLRAATHPVPKKISSAVPRNSATHWLESEGCCMAVVMVNLVFCCCRARVLNGSGAVFTVARIPIPFAAYCSCEVVGVFLRSSQTKKYRQETLLSKVESELSVISERFVRGMNTFP